MRVVGKQGQTAVVEYEEGGLLRRCLLPKTVIREYGLSIPPEIRSRGIEVGVELEDAFNAIDLPTATDLLNYLRRAGFWTREDVLGNISRFKITLAEAMGDQVADILKGSR